MLATASKTSFYSTYASPGDDQGIPKDPPQSLTMVDIPSDTLSPMHSIPSISPPIPSHNSNHTTFPATPTYPSSILWGPSLAGTSSSSPTYGNRATSTKLDVLLHSDKDTTARLFNSIPLHDGNPKGWRSSELEDRVALVIKRVTGEGVTEEMLPDNSLRHSQEHGPCSRPCQYGSGPRQQLHDPQGETRSSKGPITISNASNSSSPIDNVPSMSLPAPLACNLYHHPMSLHSRPPTTFSPKQ